MRSKTSVGVLAILIALGAYYASVGTFNIDEIIYLKAVDAFYSHHYLIVNNGYDIFKSASLKLAWLVVGPHGLTPQYPAGTAILGGLLYGLLGDHSLIVWNALASIVTLFVVRSLAREIYGDDSVAWWAVLILAVATYWSGYSVGHWPHSISVFFSCAAMLCMWRAIFVGYRVKMLAFTAGICVGFGLLFRLDDVLILPSLVVITILYARQRIIFLFWGVVGVLPGLVAMSLINYYKFGTFNPISYGGNEMEGGNHSLENMVLLVGLTLALCAWVAFRNASKGWKLPGSQRYAIILPLILLLIVVLVPDARNLLLQYARGFYGMVIDIRVVRDPWVPQELGPNNTMLFAGYPKMAWAQSLPWLGMLLFYVGSQKSVADKRALTFCLLPTFFLTFPFILHQWHGGAAPDMRYFLPAVPLLAILAARIWTVLLARGSKPRDIFYWALAGVILLILGILGWLAMNQSSPLPWILQVLPIYVLMLTAVSCLLAGWLYSKNILWVRLGTLCSAGALTLASIISVADISYVQATRAIRYSISKSYEKMLPTHSLLVVTPGMVQMRAIANSTDGSVIASFVREPHWKMVPVPSAGKKDIYERLGAPAFSVMADIGIFERALRDGYHVFVSNGSLVPIIEKTSNLKVSQIISLPSVSSKPTLYELELQ